jgi:hypothetical protein
MLTLKQDSSERKHRPERKRLEAAPIPVPLPNEKEFESKKAAHEGEVVAHVRSYFAI